MLADPPAEGGKRAFLPLGLALFHETGQHVRGQDRKGEAGGDFHIRPIPKFTDLNAIAFSVVAPDLRHAERGIDWKLGRRFIRYVNLNDDVGWWVHMKIGCALSNDPPCVCDIEASVRGSVPFASSFFLKVVE